MDNPHSPVDFASFARKPISPWLSNVVACVMCLLLVAFFITTLNNAASLNRKVHEISEGPFPVASAAGHVETMLAQISTLSNRPIFVRTPDAIENLESAYQDIDDNIRPYLEFIARHHEGARNDGMLLFQGYENLSRLLGEYVAICSNAAVPDESIRAFVENIISPAVDDLLAVDMRILKESSAESESLYAYANVAGKRSIVLACFLMTAVIASLVIFLTLLRRRRIREERLQAGLHHAVEQAQSANAAKSQFLSSMSHDIRTPLNAIIGLSTIARTQKDNPERLDECLQHIDAASHHLLSLINDVLDMGEIESGKMVLCEEAFSLPPLLDNIAEVTQSQAKEKGLAFTVDTSGLSQRLVKGDSARLSQALMNLVSNAVKYTPAGGSVHLCACEESQPQEDGAILHRFTVKDTGIGMSREFMEKMFDPFEREHSSLTHHVEGTGLGMSIAKNVADMMGGCLDVVSAPGEGTSITLAVPFKPEGELIEPSDGMREGAPLQGTVLVVEDNDLNREIAVELISQTGANVVTACNGQEAVEAVLASSDGYFSLILMDIQMPHMDGIEATERIRHAEESLDRNQVPIVAMTANAFVDDKRRALEAGMNAFMTKPINVTELQRVLASYLSAAN